MESELQKAKVKMPSKPVSSSTVEKLFRSSGVRNKVRRMALFQQERARRKKEKRTRREQREKDRKKLGDKVPQILYYMHSEVPWNIVTNLYTIACRHHRKRFQRQLRILVWLTRQ